MDPSVVVHEVVCCGLGDVILGLVMHDLVVDPSFGTLQLLITYLVGVVSNKNGSTLVGLKVELHNVRKTLGFDEEIVAI